MDVAALVLGGMPPVGLGVYLRDQVLGAPFAFRCVNGSRSDAGEQARAARALGGEVWLYTGPTSWEPDTWRDGLASILAQRRALGATGIIADAEGGWPDVTRERAESEARELGAALGAAAADTRVGFTSYPNWGPLESFAATCGPMVWCSPQIYGRTSNTAEAFASWWARWVGLFGTARCIPSIAGWNASDDHRTPEGFRAYLERLPRAPGAIAWTAAGGVPAHIAAALSTWSPGGSSIETAARAAYSFAARPVGTSRPG